MVVSFDGQVAVVTGAGRGLGAAHARLLAELGAAVVVGDAGVSLGGTHPDRAVADGVVAEITAAGGSAAACYEDVTEPGACDRVIEFVVREFGRLDVLINNARLLACDPIEDIDDALWQRFVEASFCYRPRRSSGVAVALPRVRRVRFLGRGPLMPTPI
jgi:NAD(P)-dependent dehydrogenase (short-subunit alcohol dehydrogenase family)